VEVEHDFKFYKCKDTIVLRNEDENCGREARDSGMEALPKSVRQSAGRTLLCFPVLLITSELALENGKTKTGCL
jgi:hypothetical protein